MVRWMKEKAHKATLDGDRLHLRWLDPYLRGQELALINRDVIDRLIETRRSEGVTNATVNRLLEILRAVLRKAEREWEWIDRAPIIRMLPEPKRRVRWLSREEAEKLLSQLPTHLAAMARFSLATGLREANVIGLEWSQVDLKRCVAWIHADQAKARKPIAVPLNAEAMQVLRAELEKHPRWVFVFKNKRVTKANNHAWRKALKRADIENFRWHDLRHTWASWHVQAGTPLSVLQELGGWESSEMVRKYAHLSAEHLAKYSETIAQPHAVCVPVLQKPKVVTQLRQGA